MLCPRFLVAALAVAGVSAIVPAGTARQEGGRPPQDEATELVEVLTSDAPVFTKAKACQRLAVIGDEHAVPALAALLDGDQLSGYARSALEAIPHPSVDAVLREAVGRLDGNLLIGVLNSIGQRRDVGAVAVLGQMLADGDLAVARAAARALGHIGDPAAADVLLGMLTSTAPELRPAVADACLVCAGRLLEQQQRDQAIELYDAVRGADVPEHLAAAATIDAIVARGAAGIPLLGEQLDSPDETMFRAALVAARRLGGAASGVLIARFRERPAHRRVLLLLALNDLADRTALPTILQAACTGEVVVREVAIRVLGRLGDGSVVPTLLEAAVHPDQDLAQAARSALANLQSFEIDAAIVAMVAADEPTTRRLAIDLVADRGIGAASPLLFELANDPDAAFRVAVIQALGRTIPMADLPRLLERLLAPGSEAEQAATREALQTACARMPDREVCAGMISAAMPDASTDTRGFLLEQLRKVGGTKALQTVVTCAHNEEDAMQDAATRELGRWTSADAAPPLLELATTLSNDRYRIRALRGYIRIARQMNLSPEQRLEACQNALAIAGRDDERTLAFDLLGRIMTPEALAVAVSHLGEAGLEKPAAGAALAIAERIILVSPVEVGEATSLILASTDEQPLADRARALHAQAEALAEQQRLEVGFVAVFDGRTMEGWEGDPRIFRIEEGAIVGGSLKAPVARNEFLCTEREYHDFELRLQFKILGKGANAGVQIRSRRIPDHHEVSGYQADLGDNWWGCLYDESRRNAVLAGPPSDARRGPVRMGDWNEYRIRCQGKRIQLWINGVQTTDYTEQDPDIPQSGVIGLQVHAGGPMEAWYRNIRIQELQ